MTGLGELFGLVPGDKDCANYATRNPLRVFEAVFRRSPTLKSVIIEISACHFVEGKPSEKLSNHCMLPDAMPKQCHANGHWKDCTVVNAWTTKRMPLTCID